MKIGPRPEPCQDAMPSTVRYLNRLPSSRNPHGVRALRPERYGGHDVADSATGTMARSLRDTVSAPSIDDALRSIIGMAMDSGLWDAVGLVTGDGSGVPHSRCASSPTVGRLDALQEALGQGPAVDSVRGCGRSAIVSGNLDVEGRWPRWRPAATAAGVGSVVSLRLFTDHTHGALNLYSARRNHADDDALAEADAIAAQSSVVLAYAASEHRLRQALERQGTVGRAQGVLMQRFGLSAAGAAAVLRSYADHQDVDVADLARRIISTRGPASTSERHPQQRPTMSTVEHFPSIFTREA